MNWIVVYTVSNEVRNFSLSSFLSINAYLCVRETTTALSYLMKHFNWIFVVKTRKQFQHSFHLVSIEQALNLYEILKKYDARNGFIAFSQHSHKKINANKSKQKLLLRCISTNTEWVIKMSTPTEETTRRNRIIINIIDSKIRQIWNNNCIFSAFTLHANREFDNISTLKVNLNWVSQSQNPTTRIPFSSMRPTHTDSIDRASRVLCVLLYKCIKWSIVVKNVK